MMGEEKSWGCRYCGATFYDAKKLNKHIQMHHNYTSLELGKEEEPKELNNKPLNFLVDSVKKTFDHCLSIMRKKNNDYAGLNNPFKNFETVTRVGISVQLGIFVRFLDKVTRLENLLKGTKSFVTEESIEDTINDAINYLAILKARREFENKK